LPVLSRLGRFPRQGTCPARSSAGRLSADTTRAWMQMGTHQLCRQRCRYQWSTLVCPWKAWLSMNIIRLWAAHGLETNQKNHGSCVWFLDALRLWLTGTLCCCCGYRECHDDQQKRFLSRAIANALYTSGRGALCEAWIRIRRAHALCNARWSRPSASLTLVSSLGNGWHFGRIRWWVPGLNKRKRYIALACGCWAWRVLRFVTSSYSAPHARYRRRKRAAVRASPLYASDDDRFCCEMHSCVTSRPCASSGAVASKVSRPSKQDTRRHTYTHIPIAP